MAHFDDIYEIAADNYGIITYSEVLEAGISSVELRRFVTAGRLERLGQGVYKLTRYIPTPFDQYAAAVALVGPSSFIYGESVLAMHNLALVNPQKVIVATTKRVRKTLPAWLHTVQVKNAGAITQYEGIPSQKVADALIICKNAIMKSRLADAVNDAVSIGLIGEKAIAELRRNLGL